MTDDPCKHNTHTIDQQTSIVIVPERGISEIYTIYIYGYYHHSPPFATTINVNECYFHPPSGQTQQPNK